MLEHIEAFELRSGRAPHENMARRVQERGAQSHTHRAVGKVPHSRTERARAHAG